MKKLLLTILLLLPLTAFGQVTPYEGGTGYSTYTRGDLLVATSTIDTSTTSALIKFGLGTEGQILQSVGGFLSWVASTSLPYLSTESDPIFSSSFASGIASSTNWDTAFNWGNHASAGYLTDLLGGLNAIIGNASTTNQTVSGSSYLPSITSSFLSTNQQGKIIATTTPLTSYTETDPVWLSEKASYLLSSAFNGLFDTRLNATTSLPSLTTLAGLTSIGASGATTTVQGNLKVNGDTTVATVYLVDEIISGDSDVGGSLTVDGHTILTTASTTALTGVLYPTGLSSAFLSVNKNGQIIATTTPVLTETDPVWLSEKASYLLSSAFNGLFDTRLNATTSLPKLSTLAGLATVGSTTGQTTILGKTVMTNASTTNLSASGFLSVLGNLYAGDANGDKLVFANDATNYYLGQIDAAQGMVMNGYYGLSLLGRNNLGLRVHSDGNVGIGVTAPTTKLSVSGGTAFGDFSGASAYSLNTAISNINSPTIASTTVYAPESVLRLVRGGTAGNKWNPTAEFLIGSYTNTINAQTQLDLKLGNGASHTPDTTIMSWLGSGEIYANADVKITDGLTSGITPAAGYTSLYVTDNLIPLIYMEDLGGAVGQKVMRMDMDNGTYALGFMNDTGTGWTKLNAFTLDYQGNGAFAGTLNVTGKTTMANASSTNLSTSGFLTVAGNTGLGTTTPTERLSVLSSDNASSTNIFAVRSQNLTAGVGISWNEIRAIGTNAIGNLLLNARGAGHLLLQTTSTGNVGIKTSYPAYDLDVTGYGRATKGHISGSSASGIRGYDCYYNGSNWTIMYFNSNSITPVYATSTSCSGAI